MKVAVSVGMAIALVALLVVAMNMDPIEKKETIDPKDRPIPQLSMPGQGSSVAPTTASDFSATAVGPEFEPIKDVEMHAAADAEGKVKENDLVLGVVVNDEARAYPISMLCGPEREIINDTLGGTAIAATW